MAKKKARSVAERWTPALARKGYTPLVAAFVEYACRRHSARSGGLGLTPVQAMIVIQLMYHKWDRAMPRPAVGTLAVRLGVTETTIRSNLDALVRRRLLRKHLQPGRPSYYDLTPLLGGGVAPPAVGVARGVGSGAAAKARQFPDFYAEAGPRAAAPRAAPARRRAAPSRAPRRGTS